jgi:hypothetical protein
MTSAANTHTSGTSSWDEALALYRGQLSFYLDCLIECDCSDRILAKVEAEVRSRSVPDEFKLPSMVRIMVQLVIEHMRDRSQTSDARHASTDDARSSTSNAPKLERLVYFLRDILEYSTREAALLIGITDAQVDELLSFARKRIDMYEGPSSIEIEDPNGSYFRWRFVDLHLR